MNDTVQATDRVMGAYRAAGYNCPTAKENMPNFFLGLDLGQVNDPTVLAVVRSEHILHGNTIPVSDRRLDLLHLERFDLHTPYPDIITAVAKRMRDLGNIANEITLLVDATGVGRAVVDLFIEELPADTRLAAITFTGGSTVSKGDGDVHWNVPARDLVGTAQVALQTRRLKWPKGMKYTKALVRELKVFKVKITLSKLGVPHDAYGAWRSGDHDDIVFAVSLATWGAGDAVLDFMSAPEWGAISVRRPGT